VAPSWNSLTRRSLLAGSGALACTPNIPRLNAATVESFADPPWEARPSTYWVWLNGYSDPKRITYELEELKKAGVNAAYILEIGARAGDAVPPGPAYFSKESLDAIGHAVREAGRLGIEVGITNASSWNAGGEWVTPEHASKGLYWSRITTRGPGRFRMTVPFPAVPAAAPVTTAGTPAWWREVALLAVPAKRRRAGFDFLFDIGPGVQTLTRIALHNAAADSAVKEFAVFASATGTETAAFEEVFRGALDARTEEQSFALHAVRARYLILRVISGHDPGGRVALSEFRAFTADGSNVVTVQTPIGRKITGGLLASPPEAGLEREWKAENIYDGRLTGSAGSWAASGPAPAWIDDPSESVDLTGRLDAQGVLEWDVPEGEWELYRFFAANNGEKLRAPSPRSEGFIIDHLSADAAAMHNRFLLAKLTESLGDLRKTALKYFYSCSYEVRGSIWTPKFEEEFLARRGYALRRYLPILAGVTIRDEDISTRFRIDYRRTISDTMIESFYRSSRNAVSMHGLKLVSEAGGPGWPLHQVPVDALEAQGALDIPRGEFWKNHSVWVAKETASAAHIYGQRLVQMEAFTSFRHWQDGPCDLKEIADRAFCDGANHFVWHTMPHAPERGGNPGWVYHAGTHFGPNETWWPMAKPFLDYLARCSWMLRQGVFVADVCYYYGERGYNFGPEKTAAPELGVPPGYDFDAINTHGLMTRLRVREDGRLTLPDRLTYSMLCLADRPDMDLEVLQRIGQFVEQGAVVHGPRPNRATSLRGYPATDEKVRALAARIWGPCDGVKVFENRYGRGKVYWGTPVRDVLGRLGLGPDFRYGASADLDYIHRRDGDRDFYFVRNKREEWTRAECTFRVNRRAAEICDPVSGAAVAVSAARSGNSATIPLRLPPFGSAFVVFDSSIRPAPAAAATRGPAPLLIDGPWEVRMSQDGRALSPFRMSKLSSWTEHADPDVKYFSGVAAYSREVEIPASLLAGRLRLFLDLGEVRVIARVRCNGREAGICWTRPFQVDVTGLAVAGVNSIEIEVANTWANRITGDTIQRKPKRTNARWSADAPLLASGLLGPVKLVAVGGSGFPLL
jgi:hypothetical protein